VLVFFVLWNGAVLRNNKTLALFSDDAKLTSYVDHVLKPMATALKDEKALGGWEVRITRRTAWVACRSGRCRVARCGGAARSGLRSTDCAAAKSRACPTLAAL
jgi:hypothetical protein